MPENDPIQAAARADFCRFLAACYYEPAPEFAQEKLFDSMAAAGELIGVEFDAGARRLGMAFAAEGMEGLLVDYTRLFLGPVDARANPYGSVWMGPDGLAMQDSTMDVVSLYEEGGFELSEDFRELPDHVAAELEFLYLLLFRENRALRDDDAAVSGIEALKRRFLGEHLGRWIGPFCRAVAEGSSSDFYRALAGLAQRFVHLETMRAGAS